MTESTEQTERFWSIRVNHSRLYTTVLVIIGLSTCLTIPLGLFVWYLRQTGAMDRRLVVPDWAVPVSAVICAGYMTAIALTVWLRRTEPAAGRRVTRVLNYALLPAAPFGTLVGIYGLMKVDRD
jgi:hypothetical protein